MNTTTSDNKLNSTITDDSKMFSPLVSIVVPCYNHERFVQRCIESLLEQDYCNIELMIIDDGSCDQSVKRIQSLVPACQQRFARFRFITRENMGLVASLNESLSWVRGKYYTAIASDDVMFSDKITRLVDCLESSSNAAVAFGDALFIDENEQAIFLNPITKQKSTESHGSQSFMQVFTYGREINILGLEFGKYPTLLAGNYLPAMGCVVKTSAIKEVGGWTEGGIVEDWDMWLKLSKKYSFTYLEEPVAYYRLHDTNTSILSSLEVLLDSLKLLERQKVYSTDNNYLQVYFTAKIRLQKAIIKHDPKYIKMLARDVIHFAYLRHLIGMSIKKIMKLGGVIKLLIKT